MSLRTQWPKLLDPKRQLLVNIATHAISKNFTSGTPVRKHIETKTAISNDAVANTLIRKTV